MIIERPNGRLPLLCVYFWRGVGAEQGRARACLLDAGNVAGDVLDCDGILDAQAVALALHARLVDEHARIGGEPCAGARDRKGAGSQADRQTQ